jgi:hypothetical protein
VLLGEIFGADLVLVVLVLLGFALPIWAIADALGRPREAFYDAGSHRGAWVGMLVVSLFLGIGFFFGVYYLIGVRGKVKAQMSALKP